MGGARAGPALSVNQPRVVGFTQEPLPRRKDDLPATFNCCLMLFERVTTLASPFFKMLIK